MEYIYTPFIYNIIYIFKWRITIARDCLGNCASFTIWSYKTINNNYDEIHACGWVL